MSPGRMWRRLFGVIDPQIDSHRIKGQKMPISIPENIRTAITTHAQCEYPREACGILIGTAGRVARAVPAKNLAATNRLHDRYVLDPLEILRADRAAQGEGLEILGFYHSHPDHPPIPSQTDSAAAWEGYVYLILTSTKSVAGELRAWQLTSAAGMEEIPVTHR